MINPFILFPCLHHVYVCFIHYEYLLSVNWSCGFILLCSNFSHMASLFHSIRVKGPDHSLLKEIPWDGIKGKEFLQTSLKFSLRLFPWGRMAHSKELSWGPPWKPTNSGIYGILVQRTCDCIFILTLAHLHHGERPEWPEGAPKALTLTVGSISPVWI